MSPTRPAARLLCAWAIGALAAGCASGRFTPPTVTPTPFPAAGVAWTEAARFCRALSTYRAELRVGGRLLGPTVTLAVALDTEGHVALDARVGGASVFTLRGTETRATLVIPDRRQFVTARPDEILEALVGVSIGPARLLAVLGGCVTMTDRVEHAERLGAVAHLRTEDADVYLAQVGARWRVRAATFDGVSVDYRQLGADGPERITLRTPDGPDQTELSLVVAAFDTARVGPEQFVATVPSSATPLSLQELRTEGPFARRRN